MKEGKRFATILLALAAAAFAAVSCDDDDDESTSKSLTGTMELETIPSFVHPGDVFTFTPSGVELAEDEEDETITINYYLKDNLGTDYDTLTDGRTTFTYQVPDSLADLTVTCVAYASSGYYTKSVTRSATIIDDTRSIPELNKVLAGAGLFADTRNDRKYNYRHNAGLDWMIRNLAYFETDPDGNYTLGMPYEGAPAAEWLFGGYYTWADAQKACPDGWRLPTSAEFDALSCAGDIMVDAYFNGTRMWEFWPNVRMTNSLQLFAMPLGYATVAAEYSFAGFGDYCFFWAENAGSGVCRYIYEQENDIKYWEGVSQTDFAAQVRCVR